MLGPTALGGLKAAQGLVAGPTTLVINAGGSFGLPEATKQLADRGWPGMVKVSRFVSGAGVAVSLACGIVILIAAPALLHLLYGPDFVKYATAARLFAISVTISAFAVGPIITLTATRRVRPLFVVMLARMVVAVASVAVLASAYGVNGAAASGVLTAAFSTIAIVLVQSWTRRSYEGREQPRPAAGLRRRLIKNAEFLLALSPGPPALVPDRESSDPYDP